MNSGSSRTVLYKTSSCTGFCKIQGKKKTHKLDKYLVLTLLTDILLHGHTDVGNCPWKIHAQRPLGGTTGRSCGRRAQWMITTSSLQTTSEMCPTGMRTHWSHLSGFFPFCFQAGDASFSALSCTPPSDTTRPKQWSQLTLHRTFQNHKTNRPIPL